MVWFSWCGSPSGLSGVTPEHRIRGSPAHRAGRTPAGAGRGLPPGDRAGSPTPGFGSAPSPGALPSEHTAGMTLLRSAGRRSRRELLAAALGPRRARRLRRARPTSSSWSAGGALVGRTSSPQPGPVRARHRGRGARLRPRADPSGVVRHRAWSSGGRPSPYDVLRRFTATAAGSSPRRRSCRSGWHGCSPTAPAPSGPRSGWWWATSPCWPPPGRRGDRRSPRTAGRRAPAGCAVRQGDELLGELVVRERRRRPAHPGRGAALRRPGRPGRAGPARSAGCAPSSSSGWPSCPREPRSCASRASAWSTPTTPSAGVWSATSTTAPSSTWSPWP